MVLIIMKNTETNLLITMDKNTKKALVKSAYKNNRPIKRQAEWFILQGLKKNG
jgi:hypothetical protein